MPNNAIGRLLGDAMTVPLRVGGMLRGRVQPKAGALNGLAGVPNPAAADTAHERKVAYNFFSGSRTNSEIRAVTFPVRTTGTSR